MSEIRLIEGEIFTDDRGQISSLNNFRFPGVERFYFIHHPDATVIRGWHGHQYEKKWFYAVKGAFRIALVKIDDWENPSPDLQPEIFKLTANQSRILFVPEGYANCIKAESAGSVLLVFSGKILSEAIKDSWRYDRKLWVDWKTLENKEEQL